MNSVPRCHCPDRPLHGGRRALHGALPVLVLLLIPKCPACLAAYATAFTGFSISISVAAGLRHTLLAAGALWLMAVVFLTARHLILTKRNPHPNYNEYQT